MTFFISPISFFLGNPPHFINEVPIIYFRRRSDCFTELIKILVIFSILRSYSFMERIKILLRLLHTLSCIFINRFYICIRFRILERFLIWIINIFNITLTNRNFRIGRIRFKHCIYIDTIFTIIYTTEDKLYFLIFTKFWEYIFSKKLI